MLDKAEMETDAAVVKDPRERHRMRQTADYVFVDGQISQIDSGLDKRIVAVAEKFDHILSGGARNRAHLCFSEGLDFPGLSGVLSLCEYVLT